MLNSPYTEWTGDELHGRRPVVKSVWVDLARLYQAGVDDARSVGDGLDLDGKVEGWITGRFRSVRRQWLGVVNFHVPYADGRRHEVLLEDQLVPFHALRPRDEK